MNSEFESIFARLRGILEKHSAALTVKTDAPRHYSLEASAGPAAVKAWGGKLKKPVIPVAWVQVGKAYVSYHLMGIYGNTRLLDGMSTELKRRMQGKTCFNFRSVDEQLFKELDQLTAQAIAAFKKAGYISEKTPTPDNTVNLNERGSSCS
jgi:hypothetical protein